MTPPWEVAWITGAGTGIGRELALGLAREGVKIAASARTERNLSMLADNHMAVEFYPLDVRDRAAVEEAVAEIEAALGPIDLAVLSAGVWRPMSAQKLDVDAIRDGVETNYMGVIHCLAALLPRMIERGRGHIAIISSVAGYRGMSRAGGYAPTKAALISLAECLCEDVKRFGITVSVVNPGFVDTPMTRNNDFPMPFIVSAGEAAERIIRGLKRRHFEIAFPWPLVWPLKIARILPYKLYFWSLRQFGGRRR
jgi:NAD(P)-dependent dehydrogenase (short-subunit alcohol dehydrogenase family)